MTDRELQTKTKKTERDRLTDRQTYRLTGRQIITDKDIQTDRQTERDRTYR